MRKAIKFINQLLFLDKRDQISHTKFWSNVGYACLCFTFVYAVMYGTTVDVLIWALFGVVVIGNRTIIQLFNRNAASSVNNEDTLKDTQ